MKATQINTKTKVIIIALEELVRKSKISELKEFKEKLDFLIDENLIVTNDLILSEIIPFLKIRKHKNELKLVSFTAFQPAL